jgi:hypothetical protein
VAAAQPTTAKAAVASARDTERETRGHFSSSRARRLEISSRSEVVGFLSSTS